MTGGVMLASPVIVGAEYVKIDLMGMKACEVILYPHPDNAGVIYLSNDTVGDAGDNFRVTGTSLTLVLNGKKGNIYLIASAATQTCYVLVKEFVG